MTTEIDIVERLRAKHDYARKHDAPADPLWKEAAAEIARLRAQLAARDAGLADPNAVHANLLRGSIARPSINAIIHIYGREAIIDELVKLGALAIEQGAYRSKDNG